MTDIETTQAVEGDDLSALMTPEEMAMFKALSKKRQAMKKASAGIKEILFQSLTGSFAATIVKAKKDVVTISLKDAYSDGNKYAVTFGMDTEDDKEEIDSHALALRIIDENIGNIEPLMGISNSLKLTGTYEGKKLFWQIRKLAGKE